MSVDAALSTLLLCLVFGKMSPGKKTRKKASENISTWKITLRRYIPQENCSLKICFTKFLSLLTLLTVAQF